MTKPLHERLLDEVAALEAENERLRGELALAEQAIDTARFLGKRKMDRDTGGHEDDPEAFNCVLHIAAYDKSKESEEPSDGQ